MNVSVSLTPCFSGVFDALPEAEPFQRFQRTAKTAEAVETSVLTAITLLKQGVSEKHRRETTA
jgi:hypothetical protein